MMALSPDECRRARPALAELGGRAVQEFRDWAADTYGADPEAVIANYQRVTRPATRAPGAALDHFPWAASWAGFLGAIRDDSDAQGARAAIAKVQASRPRNAMSERIPSSGGFLVPEKLRSQVLAYMTRATVRPQAMVVPMTTLRQGLPVADDPSQASSAQALGGMTFAMVEEGAGIVPSTPSFSKVVLDARKMAGLLKGVPNELLNGDSPAFVNDFLPRVIGMGLEWEEDDLFIGSGSGVGEPQALVNAPAAVTVTRSDPSGFQVSHLDIVTMLKNLHPASKACATWLLSEDAFDQLLELYEIIGTAPSGQDIPPPGTLKFNTMTGTWELLGVSAAITDHQPVIGSRGDVMLADLGLYAIGELGEMTVEISSTGEGFPADQSSVRVRHRVDGRFWPQQSYTLANGKVTSPLVILQ
jgi:HK97 family phage major capsid protein